MTIQPTLPHIPVPNKPDVPEPDTPDEIKEPVEHEHDHEPKRDPGKREEHPS